MRRVGNRKTVYFPAWFRSEPAGRSVGRSVGQSHEKVVVVLVRGLFRHRFLQALGLLLSGQPRPVLGLGLLFFGLEFLPFSLLFRVVPAVVRVEFFQQPLPADLAVLLEGPCFLALDPDPGRSVQQDDAVARLVDLLPARSRSSNEGLLDVVLVQEELPKVPILLLPLLLLLFLPVGRFLSGFSLQSVHG